MLRLAKSNRREGLAIGRKPETQKTAFMQLFYRPASPLLRQIL
jgi:hypothetical protein